MLATLLLAFALFTNQPTMTPNLQPSIGTTSTAPVPEVSEGIPAPEVTDPCADEFSNAVRNDLTGYINEKLPSVVLSPFFGDEILIFQSRGYCQPLDEAGTKMTPAELTASIVAELNTEATNNNHKITYVGKVIPILGGYMVATVVTPPAESVAAAGVDYRIFTVFIFNQTRIVGFQSFVTVTGLKTP